MKPEEYRNELFKKFQQQLTKLVDEARETKPQENRAMRAIFNQRVETLRRYLDGEASKAVNSFDNQISGIEKRRKGRISIEPIVGLEHTELMDLVNSCETASKEILNFSLNYYLKTMEDFIAGCNLDNFSPPKEGKKE